MRTSKTVSKGGYASFGRGLIYNIQIRQFQLHAELQTKIQCHYLRSFARPGMVLDVGAGTGRVSDSYAGMTAGKIVAMDLSAQMVEILKGTDSAKRREVFPLVGDSRRNLPFKDESFSGGYCFGVCPLFEDWPFIISPVSSVLKQGASFLFDLQCQDIPFRWPGSPPFRGSYRLADLANRLKDLRFQVKRVFPVGFLAPSHVMSAWNLPDELKNRVGVFGVKAWLNQLLGALPDLNVWAELETELAAVLPYNLGPSSIIVVESAKGMERPGENLGCYVVPIGNPAKIYRDVSDVLKKEKFHSILIDNRYFQLLAVISPILKLACGGRDPVADAFPDHADIFQSVRRKVIKVSAPGIATRFRKSSSEFLIRNLDRGFRYLGRFKNHFGL